MSLLTKERPGMVMQLTYLKICLVFHFFRRLNRYRWQRLHEQNRSTPPASRLLHSFSNSHFSSSTLTIMPKVLAFTYASAPVGVGAADALAYENSRLSSLFTARYTFRGVRRGFGGFGEFAPKWITLSTFWVQRQNFQTDVLNRWKIPEVVIPQSSGVAYERWSFTRGSNLRILTG